MLGHLTFSKTADEVVQALENTPDSDPKRAFLARLVENNRKITLNLDQRIVGDIFYGEVKSAQRTHQQSQDYAQLIIKHDVIAELLCFFEGLHFETRQAVEKLFSALVQENFADFVTEYFLRNIERVLGPILRGGFQDHNVYAVVQAHLIICSSMLRSCLRLDTNTKVKNAAMTCLPIYEYIVTRPNVEHMIAVCVSHKSFVEVADAMATLKEVLVCDFFGKHFLPIDNAKTPDEIRQRQRYLTFVRHYQTPIVDLRGLSTVVAMLNGLGEMLLRRTNHGIMMKYIASKHNLKIILQALRRTSSKVRSEAFHIFKIFVVNPKQPFAIKQMLIANADIIISTLRKHFDHFNSDETLVKERDKLLEIMETLKATNREEPAFYAVTQADDSRYLGVHNAEDFKRFQENTLIEAYQHRMAALADQDATPREVQLFKSNALKVFRRSRLYVDLTEEQFEELVDRQQSGATPGQASSPSVTHRYGMHVFEIVYRSIGFDTQEAAQIHYDDMDLEGRCAVELLPTPRPLRERAAKPELLPDYVVVFVELIVDQQPQSKPEEVFKLACQVFPQLATAEEDILGVISKARVSRAATPPVVS